MCQHKEVSTGEAGGQGPRGRALGMASASARSPVTGHEVPETLALS